ncbi:hypothetical protein AKJ16_DCAP01119 [Drosera capensis]
MFLVVPTLVYICNEEKIRSPPEHVYWSKFISKHLFTLETEIKKPGYTMVKQDLPPTKKTKQMKEYDGLDIQLCVVGLER